MDFENYNGEFIHIYISVDCCCKLTEKIFEVCEVKILTLIELKLCNKKSINDNWSRNISNRKRRIKLILGFKKKYTPTIITITYKVKGEKKSFRWVSMHYGWSTKENHLL